KPVEALEARRAVRLPSAPPQPARAVRGVVPRDAVLAALEPEQGPGSRPAAAQEPARRRLSELQRAPARVAAAPVRQAGAQLGRSWPAPSRTLRSRPQSRPTLRRPDPTSTDASLTRLYLVCARQLHPEGCPSTGRRLDFHIAVMQLDDAVDHREAD